MTSNDAIHNRAYGWPHRRMRKRLLREAYGMPCPICLLIMEPGQPLHLDHVNPEDKRSGRPTPASRYRITHALCNVKRGNDTRSTEQQPQPERTWEYWRTRPDSERPDGVWPDGYFQDGSWYTTQW